MPAPSETLAPSAMVKVPFPNNPMANGPGDTAQVVEDPTKFNVPVAGMIVNRLLPPDADGDFLRERRLQEDEYRDEIDQTFSGLPRVYLHLLPHDVHGVETLRKIGKAIVAQLGDDLGAAEAS